MIMSAAFSPIIMIFLGAPARNFDMNGRFCAQNWNHECAKIFYLAAVMKGASAMIMSKSESESLGGGDGKDHTLGTAGRSVCCMLPRSLSECQSLTLNVMIRVSQFVRNSQLCHLVAKSLNGSIQSKRFTYVVSTRLEKRRSSLSSSMTASSSATRRRWTRCTTESSTSRGSS